MRIAICDNDNKWINELVRRLGLFKETYGDIEWDTFCGGEDLLVKYREAKAPYDIVIIDIEMDGINGVETANQIRESDPGAEIIFLTAHADYAVECFECRPLQFLTKPIDEGKFDKTMHRAINNMKDKYITINQSNGITRLRYSEVYYVEGRGHNVIINLRDSEISIYMAFSKFLGLLDMDRCALTHKSFAVNMEYVREFGSRDVILTNGAAVPLSRSRKTEFKKNFLRYVTRR